MAGAEGWVKQNRSMKDRRIIQYIGSESGESALRIADMPYSKSYLLRVMTMIGVEGCTLPLQHWDAGARGCDDVSLMQQAVLLLTEGDSDRICVGAAGAVWRFMIALSALRTDHPLHFVTEGRLAHRPILPLIETLNRWGARIVATYSDKGIEVSLTSSDKPLCGGSLANDVLAETSQFGSALMLIAPALLDGLTLSGAENVPSSRYLELTASLMRRGGADVCRDQGGYIVRSSHYNEARLGAMLTAPERDWSAASYPYGWVAQENGPQALLLEGYRTEDLQGDKRIAEDFASLGVASCFVSDRVLLRRNKERKLQPEYRFDLGANPDLAPAYAATLLGLGTPFALTNLSRLAFKESNRLESLCRMAESFGFALYRMGDSLHFDGKKPAAMPFVSVDPQEDHRLAMASTILTLATKCATELQEPLVADKSFRSFYSVARQVGFRLTECN